MLWWSRITNIQSWICPASYRVELGGQRTNWDRWKNLNTLNSEIWIIINYKYNVLLKIGSSTFLACLSAAANIGHQHFYKTTELPTHYIIFIFFLCSYSSYDILLILGMYFGSFNEKQTSIANRFIHQCIPLFWFDAFIIKNRLLHWMDVKCTFMYKIWEVCSKLSTFYIKYLPTQLYIMQK